LRFWHLAAHGYNSENTCNEEEQKGQVDRTKVSVDLAVGENPPEQKGRTINELILDGRI